MTTKHQHVKDNRHLAAAEKLRAGVPLSIADWCAMEGVSREGWYQAARRGEAPAHYYNGHLVRIAAADYAAWVEARKADAKLVREVAA